MEAILSGGPRHGTIYLMGDTVQELIYTAEPEPIDITTFGSLEPHLHRSTYRPRGRYRCGNYARDVYGHVIYDYQETEAW